MVSRDRIVIGASAGGVTALQQLVAGFPADLPAAVFITLHMYSRTEAVLPDLLSVAGSLTARLAEDGERIENGRIYVAPPDYHLLLTPETVHLSHGPKEGLQRPSINAMFRSAANVFRERIAGVVLTGMLDDGAAGLWEILERGGVTVVQEPDEAAYRSMPESAIHGLKVHYILRLNEMASLLTRLSMGERREFQTMNDVSQPNSELSQAPLTRQACPECGGVMRLEQSGGVREYVCHVGHRLGLQSMITDKTDVIERTMWKAVSQSEELIELLEQAQAQAGNGTEAAGILQEVASRRGDMQALRAVLERRKLNFSGK